MYTLPCHVMRLAVADNAINVCVMFYIVALNRTLCLEESAMVASFDGSPFVTFVIQNS